MSNTRIVLNTTILYAKMAITTLISLYTVRLVLDSLGTIDYGIHNVIMGVVAMLAFFNAALSVSTQRYLSYYQGQGESQKMIEIFNHSLFLHILFGLVVVILLESIGTLVLNQILTIPIERLAAATVIYHFVSLSVFFTFVSVPFSAAINANERMEWIAIVSVFESLGKFLIAIYLSYTSYDKLIVYGIGVGCITIVAFILYFIVCYRFFAECRHISFRKIKRKILYDFGKFVGWSIVGSVTALSKNHGISILFNIFNGPAVNAAYGVANQVSAQLNYFSATMIRSLNPQIMKSEGAGNHQKMLFLSTQGCKYGFLLLSFFSIPFIFEMPSILGIWLKQVPEYSVVFCDLVLVAMMFDQLTVGINSAFQASNLVKQSAIYVGAVKLLILPLGFILLNRNYSVYYVIVIYAIVELVAGWVRLLLAKYYLNYSLRMYSSDVYIIVVIPVVCSITACIVVQLFSHSIYRFIYTIVISMLTFSVFSYFYSLNQEERKVVNHYLIKLKEKCFPFYEKS